MMQVVKMKPITITHLSMVMVMMTNLMWITI
jgi:hypothetical protein